MNSSLPFERLSDSRTLLPFDCGDEDINDFFVSQALHYQNELLAVTYFLEDGENKDYPAVKIGRLGVSKIYQHTGDSWGTKIIDYIKHWMVSENKTGCRFITVYAYCSAVQKKKKNGFMFMGTDERLRYESGTAATVAMYYDLKHIC